MAKWIHRFRSFDEFDEAYNNNDGEFFAIETADGIFKFGYYNEEYDQSTWYNAENDKALTTRSRIPKVGIWDYEANGLPFDENDKILDSFVGAMDFNVEWDGQGNPPEGFFVEILSVKAGMYKKPWLSAVDGGIPCFKIVDNGDEFEYECIGKKFVKIIEEAVK